MSFKADIGGPRSWGFWTRGKLEVLRDYLFAYALATKSAGERIYLDLFAGRVHNTDRITGESIDNSVQIALGVNSPRFTRLRFFELEENATELRKWLAANYPGRDVEVYGGDCNGTIAEALRDLRSCAWAPSFAFVDPNGLEASGPRSGSWQHFVLAARRPNSFFFFPPRCSAGSCLWQVARFEMKMHSQYQRSSDLKNG